MTETSTTRLDRMERIMELIQAEVSTLSIRLTKVETMDPVTTAAIERIEHQVGEVKGNIQWLVRLIVGAIVGGLITMLFNGVPSFG